jgi:hypothetical protein
VAPAPRPVPLAIYDYWVTNGNTSVDLNVPAGFFGSGSNPLNTKVQLTGQPFGPGGGPGLPAAADTSVRRTKDPSLPAIGSVATVGIKMKGLSLASIAPVTVTYSGGGTELWNVHVGLSSLAAQPQGSLTATKTYSGGGTLDSSMTVVPKFTFTRVSGGDLHPGRGESGLGDSREHHRREQHALDHEPTRPHRQLPSRLQRRTDGSADLLRDRVLEQLRRA